MTYVAIMDDNKKNKDSVFSGKTGMSEFLDPRKAPPSPLLEISRDLNPFLEDRVHIFAKALFFSPTLNIKHFAAYSLLQDACDRDVLSGVHTLVENSSGNMALSLAVLAPLFGIYNVVAIVPRDIPSGKIDLLRLFGVSIEFHDMTPGSKSGIVRAKELGEQDGWLNLGQYDNPANPYIYEHLLAPQIWEQTKEELTVLCVGLGSTGTATGSAKFFKENNHMVSVVGVAPRTDSVPGVRSLKKLSDISFSWKDSVDYMIETEAKNAFRKSLWLCRSGILAGPSSGMAFAGLVHFLKEQKEKGTLDALRNKKGEVVAVFVCPDSAIPYLDKYSTHLDSEDFRSGNNFSS